MTPPIDPWNCDYLRTMLASAEDWQRYALAILATPGDPRAPGIPEDARHDHHVQSGILAAALASPQSIEKAELLERYQRVLDELRELF